MSIAARPASLGRRGDTIEMISQEPVRHSRYPVAFRGCNGGVAGPFYDMQTLRDWFDSVPDTENPTMPHSREPAYVAIHRMAPVRWRGESAQRHEETARLLDETKEALARRFTVLQRRLGGDEYREYGQYVRFRNLMAKAISDPRLQSLEWLRDYWLFHPFVPDRDIERGNRARPDPAFVWGLNHQRRKSKTQFRLEMARRLRPGTDYHRMVQEYWRTHPIDTDGDDEATREEYAWNTR
jgi:hypothetical protein